MTNDSESKKLKPNECQSIVKGRRVQSTTDKTAALRKPPSVAQVQQNAEKAKTDGFEQGRREGLQAGTTEVHKRLSELEKILHSLSSPLEKIDDKVEGEILQLVIGLTSQLLQREMCITPEYVLDVIREAKTKLPSSTSRVYVHLNPMDCDLVKNYLEQHKNDAEQQWEIVLDPAVARGGCKLVTETAQIDATLETRIASACAQVLGKEPEEIVFDLLLKNKD